jgi:predicted ArsR family transcriptional regulator
MQTIKGRKVTDSQKAVYDVLKQYGPLADHALVPMAQHMVQVHQSSSGIRTRRKELEKIGLVKAVSETRTGSGRAATVFQAVR